MTHRTASQRRCRSLNKKMGIDGAHTRCSSIISCLSAFDGLLLPTLFPFAWRSTVSRRSLVLGFFVPGGYIPTLETKQRECWKFKTRGVNSEFDSRVSVRPSNILFSSYVRGFVIQTMLENSLFLLVSYPLLCSPTCVSLLASRRIMIG